jgi:hypothetical protein
MSLPLPKSGSEFAVPFTADILDLMSEVTLILGAIEQGELHAAEQLLPLVYDELRKLAGTSTPPASTKRSDQYHTSGSSAISSPQLSTKAMAAAREKATGRC